MKRQVIPAYLALLCLTVLGACTADYEREAPARIGGTVSFQVEQRFVGQESNRALQTPVQGITHIVLSIEGEEGTQTAYSEKSLPVLAFGDKLLVEEIQLPLGSYQLTSFYLTDSLGNILYATPLEGSAFAEFLERPLPLPIEVGGAGEVVLEVVSTAAHNPEQFGFESGMKGFRETFYFFMSVIREKVDGSMEHVPADVKISAKGYELALHLTHKLNKIVLPRDADSFQLSIQRERFQSVTLDMSYEDLIEFSQHSLTIEMVKNRHDDNYIGGLFPGSITLSTQSQLDSLAAKGYDAIQGDLIIGNTPIGAHDPIVSLAGLSSIDEVQGNLSLSKNPALTSLEGLQYIEWIEGQLTIEDNPNLESLDHFESLKEITSLRLVNNPNVREFGAFQHIETTLQHLHIVKMDYFESFESLGAFPKLQTLTITANPRLVDLVFHFPADAETVHSVTISENPLLRSFGGQGIHGLTNVETLVLENNERLENLEGILGERKAIRNNIAIKGNTSLRSLQGLKFLPQFTNIHIEDNASLNDLTAFSQVRKITGRIFIINNPVLETLRGFDNVQQILYDQNSPLLTTDDSNATLPILVRIKDNAMLSGFCHLGLTAIGVWDRINRRWSSNHSAAVEIIGNAHNPALGDYSEWWCGI